MMYQIKSTNKQTFLARNSFKILAVFFIVLVPVFILSISGTAESAVSGVLSPVFKAGGFVYGDLNIIPKFFSDKVRLAEENQNLLNEVEESRVRVADYESLRYENQKLREELGVKPLGDFATASVLARSPQLPLDSMLIDKGSADGLKNGDLVLAGQRNLIGKLAKVSKNRATIVLNSFAESVTYGYLERTSEPLEMKGDGGGCLGARVPIDFDIEVGDKIMVNSSGVYLAAVVGIIEEDVSSGFKNIFMSLPVNVSKTNIVFVESVITE